jgi:hypothetical protein
MTAMGAEQTSIQVVLSPEFRCGQPDRLMDRLAVGARDAPQGLTDG